MEMIPITEKMMIKIGNYYIRARARSLTVSLNLDPDSDAPGGVQPPLYSLIATLMSHPAGRNKACAETELKPLSTIVSSPCSCCWLLLPAQIASWGISIWVLMIQLDRVGKGFLYPSGASSVGQIVPDSFP